MTVDWLTLSGQAWQARQHARILGRTAVGCAVLGGDGRSWVGCNVEHTFRSHDIHAEVNAISSMIAAGEQHLVAVLVAADRDRFLPCGACLDWIFEFGGKACQVAWQQELVQPPAVLQAGELMPYYPA